MQHPYLFFLFWSLTSLGDCLAMKPSGDKDVAAPLGQCLKKRPAELKEPHPNPLKKSRISKAPVAKIFQREDVSLKEGKGTKQSGGGKGGHYWHIFAGEQKAGKVFINLTGSESTSPQASLQIFLSKAFQGKHIGRYAYQIACETSAYDTIYAHIRKGNAASIKAAAAAGFQEVKDASKQMLMRWVRAKKG